MTERIVHHLFIKMLPVWEILLKSALLILSKIVIDVCYEGLFMRLKINNFILLVFYIMVLIICWSRSSHRYIRLQHSLRFGLEVVEVPPSVLHLLFLRSFVVVLLQHVRTHIHPLWYRFNWDFTPSCVRDCPLPQWVRCVRGRTLWGRVIGTCGVAVVRVSVVGTIKPILARTSSPVAVAPNGRLGDTALASC